MSLQGSSCSVSRGQLRPFCASLALCRWQCPAWMVLSTDGAERRWSHPSTKLRAVEQELQSLLCQWDLLFFHQLGEEAKSAALRFLVTFSTPQREAHPGTSPGREHEGGPALVVFSYRAWVSRARSLCTAGCWKKGVWSSAVIWHLWHCHLQIEFVFPWDVPSSSPSTSFTSYSRGG